MGALGADAPVLNYKEVAEWPTPVLNAAGIPAAWNLIQVAGVTVDDRGHGVIEPFGYAITEAAVLATTRSGGTAVPPAFATITYKCVGDLDATDDSAGRPIRV